MSFLSDKIMIMLRTLENPALPPLSVATSADFILFYPLALEKS